MPQHEKSCKIGHNFCAAYYDRSVQNFVQNIPLTGHLNPFSELKTDVYIYSPCMSAVGQRTINHTPPPPSPSATLSLSNHICLHLDYFFTLSLNICPFIKNLWLRHYKCRGFSLVTLFKVLPHKLVCVRVCLSVCYCLFPLKLT